MFLIKCLHLSTFTILLLLNIIIFISGIMDDKKIKFIKIPLKKITNNIAYENHDITSHWMSNEMLYDGIKLLENSDSLIKVNALERNRRDVDGTKSSNNSKVELTETLAQGYYMEIQIGTPSQSLNILIDTGSSDFALASEPNPVINKFFDPSRSSTFSANKLDMFKITYTHGELMGYFGQEMVRIPPLVAIETNVGFVTDSKEFFMVGSNWQGILGLAYPDLAYPGLTYPGPLQLSMSHRPRTVWEDIVQSMNIADIFTLSLCKYQGSLTVGGIDESEFLGDIHYIPIKREWYYDVLVADILLGDDSLGLDCKEYNFDRVVIDSGTTYLHFPPTTFYQLINNFIKNVQVEFPEGFWYGLEAACYYDNVFPWESLPNLTISFFASLSSSEVVNLTISPHLYIREVYFSSEGWLLEKRCYKLSISKSREGSVIGGIFMEGFYTVFDRQHKRIGFAVSSCSKPGWSDITTSNKSAGDPSQCSYETFKENRGIIIAFILTCVLICCFLFFSLLFFVIKVEFFQNKTEKSLNSDQTSHLDSPSLKH